LIIQKEVSRDKTNKRELSKSGVYVFNDKKDHHSNRPIKKIANNGIPDD
jgi:hypothetical protein